MLKLKLNGDLPLDRVSSLCVYRAISDDVLSAEMDYVLNSNCRIEELKVVEKIPGEMQTNHYFIAFNKTRCSYC
jgi:hypothetical protein